jgi:hypothetical protein
MNTIIHAFVFVSVAAWIMEQTLSDPGFWPLYLPLLVLLQASAMLIVLAVMTGILLHRRVRQ